ncbi:MAG: hypothetical protein ACSLFK_15850 [Gemmatimonadaceae bacterium]
MRLRLASLTFVLHATLAASVSAQSAAGIPEYSAVPQQVALLPERWRPGADTLDSLLPVLDDAGNSISESAIKSKMRRFGAPWWLNPPAFVAGGLSLLVATYSGGDNDCSVYEPCTDREKFLRRSSFSVGGVLGVVLVNAIFPGVNRVAAVEKIRAERRALLPRQSSADSVRSRTLSAER